MHAEVHRNVSRKKFGGRAGCSGHGLLNHRAIMREDTAALTREVAAQGIGAEQLPAERLLFRRLKIFPSPRSPVALALMAVPRPELPVKVLLLTQALLAWVSR